jgi:predicted nucleotidyltransferase
VSIAAILTAYNPYAIEIGKEPQLPGHLDSYRDRLFQFSRKWNVNELAVFGSFLRGDTHPDSDVDILVSFDRNTHRDLFDLVAMQDELQEIFGRNVDLVEKEGLRNPIRRAAILKNCQVIYAA